MLEGCWDPSDESLTYRDPALDRDRGYRLPPSPERRIEIAEDRRERHIRTYVGAPRETKKAVCHPDRKHLSGGLCAPCYKRARHASATRTPEQIEKSRAHKRVANMTPEQRDAERARKRECIRRIRAVKKAEAAKKPETDPVLQWVLSGAVIR